jgi:hypothetical protein
MPTRFQTGLVAVPIAECFELKIRKRTERFRPLADSLKGFLAN